MDERSYWLGFSAAYGIGPARFSRLLKQFGSAKDAWNASLTDLSVIGEKTALQFDKFRNDFSIPEYEKKLKEQKVGYLTLLDSEYPKDLKKIKNPPFVLYGKGQYRNLPTEKVIAIVGTRKITEYGRMVTELLTRELVEAGCSIVSGLALGVDGVAHKAALDSGGTTVAVLGCGVDCCYPLENTHIYNNILKSNGAIISEYPLGATPTKGSFPSRNRIIAGLSLGVLVTEGALDSGSLITAKDAFENKRKVFAVPGPINSSLSNGPYKLIQQGGKLVTGARDIIDELGINHSEFRKAKGIRSGDTKEEQKIIDLLKDQDLHFDELVRMTRMDVSYIGSILSVMEMKGFIKSVGTGSFSLNIS